MARLRSAALVPVLVASALALVACGGGDDSDAEEAREPTTTSSTTTTTPAPTTTATTTPPPPAPPQTCKTPEEAATSLHDGWAVGDQAAAARCALPAAVSALFGGPSGPAAGEFFAGCFGQASPVTCSYAYEGGGINFTIVCAASLGIGCQVTAVSFVAD